MVDKRTTIIMKAIKLFAAKGYHSTSIKEIADESGIAKGTLYNYFESKLDVMLSILKYYSEMMTNEVDNIAKDETLAPKEIFSKQIHFQLEECVKHQDFIEMYMREYAIHADAEINEYLNELRASRFHWLTDCLRKVYGPEIDQYILDLATIVNGIIREYMQYIILDKKEFDLLKLSKFIINQLDELVSGYLSSGEYFLEYSDLEEMMKLNNQDREQLNRKLKRIIQQVLQKTDEKDLPEDMIKKIKTTMEVFEDELINKEEPKLIVIEGLLVFLRTLNLTDFEQYWNHLDEIFQEYRGTFLNDNT